MFYQVEYAALIQILDLTHTLNIANKKNKYLGIEQAERIIKSVFQLESLDIEDLPHSWKREPLSSEQIDVFVDLFKKTIKFNKAEERGYLIDHFRDILTSVSQAREVEPSSFVLYGVWENQYGDFEPESLILIDQIEAKAWWVQTPSDSPNDKLCLSPLYCHAISADFRGKELTELESPPEGLMKMATQAIPGEYKDDDVSDEYEDVSDEDEFVLTTTFKPLVTIRDGVMVPSIEIDKLTLDPSWFWYITGFPGLTVFSHWVPDALFSQMDDGDIYLDELSNEKWYCTSSIVSGVGFILYCLAARGFIKLPASATAFEAQLFMSGYEVLCVTHLLQGVMASNFPIEGEDFGDFSTINLAGHNLFPIKNRGRIPTQEEFAKTNAISFLLEAENIFLVGKNQVSPSLPNRRSKGSVVKAEFYTIGGLLENQQSVFVGIHDITLSVSKRVFLMAATEFITNLTEKELCLIMIDSSQFGFDELGALAVADPCHYEFFDTWFGERRLRQHAPLITGDSLLNSAIRKTRMSELLTPSFRDRMDNLDREWKQTLFIEIEANKLFKGGEIEQNPFKIKGKLESKLSAVTDDLFETVEASNLKQILIDNLTDDDDFITELSYQNCRMVDGIYLDEGPVAPGVMQLHLLLESARKWFDCD
jgi:hypothetical protein